MKSLTNGELKELSGFFNTISAAWFTGGIIAPFFTKLEIGEKIPFLLIGLGFSYIFLRLSLYYARGTK